MDIAGVSMAMSNANLANQVGISVMKLAMNTSVNAAAGMTDMLQESPQAVQPNLGSNIDFRV